MEVQWLDIETIRPYPNNPRDNQQTIHKVVKSIQHFGWQQPIVVDKNKVIIAGHTRYQAAQCLKLTHVPVIVAEHLSENQANCYRVADNKLAQHSRWQPLKLAQELNQLHERNTLGHSGFTEEEYHQLMRCVQQKTKKIEPPLIHQPVSQLGDCFELGAHRVLCGDATDNQMFKRLMGDTQADMLLTDPPYGIGYRKYYYHPWQPVHSKHVVDKTMLGEQLDEGQYHQMLLKALKHCLAFKKPDAASYIFGHPKNVCKLYKVFEQLGIKPTQAIIWNKLSMGLGQAHYRPQFELIFYFKGNIFNGGKNQSDTWSIPRVAKNQYRHPTQKPQALLERAIINSSQPNAIILDCFGGSGSTLMACETTKRQARIIELDANYLDTMLIEWQRITGQQALLLPERIPFSELKQHRTQVNHCQ